VTAPAAEPGGKVAVVTGGGSGIGLATCARLASGRLGYMTGHPLVVDGGMSAL
jgi:NADP-dependent 3-hydroxy acid dehydrogenase YdfG